MSLMENVEVETLKCLNDDVPENCKDPSVTHTPHVQHCEWKLTAFEMFIHQILSEHIYL